MENDLECHALPLLPLATIIAYISLTVHAEFGFTILSRAG